MPQAESSGGKHAVLVAAGIFLSRLAGLARDRVFAHYFGNSSSADAFRAALRIPNFLQNLFGEGALSASFIPVYANLLARDETEEAGAVAGAVAGLLALASTVLVAIGVLISPLLIGFIAPGFTGERRELTIRLVRILFPGAGLVVLSAWCLGILNSHRRFFLSYAAPVVWNAAMLFALIYWGGRTGQERLAELVAWASVAGNALQFGMQLPVVLRLAPALRLSLDTARSSVRTVTRNFVPVFLSRGVVQVSAYIDSLLASLLPVGAVSSLGYAQTLYTLPVSLFGMSISATELTAMSSEVGNEDEVAARLRKRLTGGLRRIAFFVVPSAVAFLALGDVIAGAIYQSGEFRHVDAVYVWGILAGSAVGLLASTLGRLYSSAYYALHDTRTPLRFAVLRVTLTTVLGYLCAKPLPVLLGIDPKWGVAGLTASAGVSGWIEFALLRASLNRRIGQTGLDPSLMAKLWTAALAGAGAAWALKWQLPAVHPILLAAATLPVYGGVYLGLAALMKVPETKSALDRFLRLRRR